jgi:phosphoribosylamine--glycine ligase
MRILFVSGELIGADLCVRLKGEGNDVKMYIRDPKRRECLDGMVKKTNDWKKELEWVGKKGLIVFDDVGFGREQDRLRKEGYRVFGGSAFGDRLEKNREYGQKILEECGILTARTYFFRNAKQAYDFVKEHPATWVIKNGNHDSSLCYVGHARDGSDSLGVLSSYQKSDVRPIYLQEKISGVEIAVGRFFNGNDWVGPLCLNIEHKSLFPGGMGPLTGEMGTLMWYDDDERNKLFQSTLAKVKPVLQRSGYKGYIDINCIVNKKVVTPLEITSRFGCPTNQLQTELHVSPWTELLSAVADGNSYALKCKRGYGIVIMIATPPFPYQGIATRYFLKGAVLRFRKSLSDEDMKHIHFEEIALNNSKGEQEYSIAGRGGFVLYVTGSDSSVQEARRKAYHLARNVILPKMFYRTDIGESFIKKDSKRLKQWGWI